MLNGRKTSYIPLKVDWNDLRDNARYTSEATTKDCVATTKYFRISTKVYMIAKCSHQPEPTL